jgi:hypothetical protein
VSTVRHPRTDDTPDIRNPGPHRMSTLRHPEPTTRWDQSLPSRRVDPSASAKRRHARGQELCSRRVPAQLQLWDRNGTPAQAFALSWQQSAHDTTLATSRSRHDAGTGARPPRSRRRSISPRSSRRPR